MRSIERTICCWGKALPFPNLPPACTCRVCFSTPLVAAAVSAAICCSSRRDGGHYSRNGVLKHTLHQVEITVLPTNDSIEVPQTYHRQFEAPHAPTYIR